MAVAFDTTANGWTLAELEDANAGTVAITANVPVNVVDGDLMIGICVNVCSANPSPITLPDGWTSIVTNDGGNDTFRTPFEVAWRVANNEPASYTWGINGNLSDDLVAIFRVTGVDTASVLTGTASAASEGQTASPVSPSITTGVANALAVFCAFGRTASSLTAEDSGEPSGTTRVLVKRTRNHSSGAAIGVAVQAVSAPGATGTKTWTDWYSDSTRYLSAATFALSPSTATFVPQIIVIG